MRIASPLIFATMGELICERAGVLNLGIEGIMVAGAFAGWMAVYSGLGLWPGVAVAMAVGMAFGLLHGVLTVPLGLSQHVVGLGITLLASAATYFTYRLALPEVTTPPRIAAFVDAPVPVLSDIPVIGPALFAQTPLTYAAFAVAALTALVLYRTPLGLAIRAVGENPAAVEAQGLSVAGLRIGAVVVGSGLMAVGGAFLTMSAFNSFFFEMVNGRGWICIALVVFGGWKPGKAVLGALLFAAFDALQIRLQQTSFGAHVPVPAVPDAALPAVDPGAGRDVAARRGTGGADDPVQQGRAMMFDLIVAGGTLPCGRVTDIGIRGDRIAALGDLSGAEAGERIDATGDLVSPPFVDPHFHMDATLSYGLPRVNASGTLLEGIALWGELKEVMTEDEVRDRAIAYCDWAASMGLLHIRSHVDTSDDRLTGVRALLEVREAVKGYIDLQLVAFPQDGLYRSPSALANTIRALDMGVDVVGGIPHFERTMAEGAASVRALCEIAAERGLMIDLHCDETDDPMSRHVETLAAEVTRLGLHGRAAGSHLTSMHSMDNYYVSKLLPLIAEAGLAAIPNPLINITIQGRHDTLPEAPRPDPGEGDAGRGDHRRLGPGLRARPVVSAGDGRHAGRGVHGAACRADDASGRDARLLRHGDSGERQDPEPRGLRPRRGLHRVAGGARRGRPGRGAAAAARSALRHREGPGDLAPGPQRRPAVDPRAPRPRPAAPRPRPLVATAAPTAWRRRGNLLLPVRGRDR